MYRREIIYTGRPQCNYAMYIDGELIGFAPTYHEASEILDQLIFDLMTANFHVKDQKDV